MALTKRELLELKIRAMGTPPPADKAVWAQYWAELAKFNAYAANMPKPDLKERLEFIIAEAAKIEDTAEREEFKKGAMAGLFSDLAAYRKAHPKKKSIGAKVWDAYKGAWKMSGGIVKEGLAFGVSMVGGAVNFAITPFIPALKKMLNLAGKLVPDNIEDMIVEGYNTIIGQHVSYDADGNFDLAAYNKFKQEGPPAKAVMIKVITDYVKDLKNKALKNPKEMSKAEQQIYQQIVKGEKVVHDLAREKAAQTLGEAIFDHKNEILLALGGIAAFFLGRKLLKKAS
jgi:hypothetical protein